MVTTPVVSGPAAAGGPVRDAVTLYRRTYMSVLRSSGDIPVRALQAAHAEMGASLHPHAASPNVIDAGAFLYCIQRLPDCIDAVDRIVLAQLPAQFEGVLGRSVREWRKVQAPARRRHWNYDGERTLAVYLTSPSDLDDMIPTVVAFQIEWNKMHHRLALHPQVRDGLLAAETFWPADENGGDVPPRLLRDLVDMVQGALEIAAEDWDRLQRAWGPRFWHMIAAIARGEKQMTVRLIGGTHTAYAKVVAAWWTPIVRQLERHRLLDRPLYFVSSNPHGLVNLCSGYARRREDRMMQLLDRLPADDPDAADLRGALAWSNRDNVLYFLNRLSSRLNPGATEEKMQRTIEEEARGIWHIAPAEGVDVAAQIIELRRLRAEDLDPRLRDVADALISSRAVILNVDYPLGLAAYRIFRTLTETLDTIRGLYVVGKAATLNGAVGDVMISSAVYDEHSQNVYSFPNAFRYHDVAPYLARGSVLDRQKAVTVRGTFLQNLDYLELFYRENYTVVEMEAGPYLSAVYEATQPVRHPIGEHIHFQALPFDLGIIHYASDTPYTRTWTLGGRSLSFAGIDSTYAATVAVLRRIAQMEEVQARVAGKRRRA